MSDKSVEDQLSEMRAFCTEAFVRRWKKKADPKNKLADWDAQENLKDDLLARWAVSPEVMALAKHLHRYPDCATATMFEVSTECRGRADGALDAYGTVFGRRMTGDETFFSVYSQEPTLVNGPNHLVAWTLSEALERISVLTPTDGKTNKSKNGDAGLPAWLKERKDTLLGVRRCSLVADFEISGMERVRPGPSALRSAGKSRNELHVLGMRAFDLLERLESGDTEAMDSVLLSTVYCEMEPPTLFEMYAAVSVSELLASKEEVACSYRVNFNGGHNLVVAEIKGKSCEWRVATQRTYDLASEDDISKEELFERLVLDNIGLDQRSSRTDVVIEKRMKHKPQADWETAGFVECKWFYSDTKKNDHEKGRDDIKKEGPNETIKRKSKKHAKEAAGQLVRYCLAEARKKLGKNTMETAWDLSRRSAVLLAHIPVEVDSWARKKKEESCALLSGKSIGNINHCDTKMWLDNLCNKEPFPLPEKLKKVFKPSCGTSVCTSKNPVDC